MKFFESLVDSMIRAMSKSPEDEARIRAELARDIAEDAKLEPLGKAMWQLTNQRLDALRVPYTLSLDEFRRVVLPALQHINALPVDAQGERLSELLFAFAGNDWWAWGQSKDALLMHCDASRVRDFVHGVCTAYDILKRAERENTPYVRALWPHRCPVCRENRPPEISLEDGIRKIIADSVAGREHISPGSMEAKLLLAQFAAGRYELAHEVCDEDGELMVLCPGPFFTNQI